MHTLPNTDALLTFVANLDPFDAIDVEPHNEHFHVAVSHSPTLINVTSEAHAYALAEILTKAGYLNVHVIDDGPAVVKSLLDDLFPVHMERGE